MAKRKNIKTQYGKVSLIRTKCPECSSISIVQEGKTLCCGAAVDIEVIHRLVKMTPGMPKRKVLTPSQKETMLFMQDFKCFYCDCDLENTWYTSNRLKYPKQVTIEFDHMMPFSVTMDDDVSNFVAACNVCNQLKKARVFNSVEDIKKYISAKKAKYGYEIL